MNFRFLILISLGLMTFLITACENEPNTIGIDLIESDLIFVKNLDSQTDSLTQSGSYFKKIIPLGLAARVLIGKTSDLEASTLLRFVFSLRDSTKQDVLAGNITVQDAWIELTRSYLFGDTLGNISFTTHKVNNKWSATVFTVDSLQFLNYDAEDIGSNYAISDSNYKFNISNELVFSWMKNSSDASLESNEGIYLKPGATTGSIIGYESFTLFNTNIPRLSVVINKAGVYTDTISGFIFADVSLVDGEVPLLASDLFAVQSSVAINAALRFDISSIPKGANIHNAELILTRDTIETKTGSSYNNSLRTYFISDSSTNAVTDGSELVLNFNNNQYSGTITSYVRRWVREQANQGLLIRAGNQIEGVELFALKNSTAEFSVRPRLRIVYSVKEGI